MNKASQPERIPKTKLPLARNQEIVVQEINGELLVYDLKTNRAHNLNETAAMVWKLCDGRNSALEMSSEISHRINAAVPEEIVWLAVDQLNRRGLLEDFPISHTQTDAVSRREMIRKAGMASMIALPIVSSVIAPKPASAQSVQSGCLPLNVCIPPSNICPPACNGRTIIYDLYASNNGSCTNFQAANIPLACGPGGFFSVVDIEVTNA